MHKNKIDLKELENICTVMVERGDLTPTELSQFILSYIDRFFDANYSAFIVQAKEHEISKLRERIRILESDLDRFFKEA